jgi:hypothetical protein
MANLPDDSGAVFVLHVDQHALGQEQRGYAVPQIGEREASVSALLRGTVGGVCVVCAFCRVQPS